MRRGCHSGSCLMSRHGSHGPLKIVLFKNFATTCGTSNTNQDAQSLSELIYNVATTMGNCFAIDCNEDFRKSHTHPHLFEDLFTIFLLSSLVDLFYGLNMIAENRAYIHRKYLSTQQLVALDLDEQAAYRRRLIDYAHAQLQAFVGSEEAVSRLNRVLSQVTAGVYVVLGNFHHILEQAEYLLAQLRSRAC